MKRNFPYTHTATLGSMKSINTAPPLPSLFPLPLANKQNEPTCTHPNKTRAKMKKKQAKADKSRLRFGSLAQRKKRHTKIRIAHVSHDVRLVFFFSLSFSLSLCKTKPQQHTQPLNTQLGFFFISSRLTLIPFTPLSIQWRREIAPQCRVTQCTHTYTHTHSLASTLSTAHKGWKQKQQITKALR